MVSTGTATYRPHTPGNGVLGDLVRDHLDELLDRVAEDTSGRTLPAFAVRELRRLSECSDFVHGFARYRCADCRADRILPFSCGGRVCPSCAGRRMADTASFLVDRVLNPGLRWRQYVITFPPPMAVALCFRGPLAAAVTRLCVRVLFEFFSTRADDGVDSRIGTDGVVRGEPKPAAVVWPQRFADGLGAWHHIHLLTPDGVFRSCPDRLEAPFTQSPPPTASELQDLVCVLADRVDALIRRHARTGPDDALLELCAKQPASAMHSSTPPNGKLKRPHPLRVEHRGYTLHAATSVAPGRPAELERLLRYLARPPLSLDRLSRLPDGRIQLRLKRARGRVTRYLFEPVALLARLAALIPPPHRNQVLYFGALATASPLRPFVIPVPPDPTPARPVAPPRPRRMSHPDLLRRTLAVEFLRCDCGGTLRRIAVIRDPDVVQAVAAAIIMSTPSTRGPPGARAC